MCHPEEAFCRLTETWLRNEAPSVGAGTAARMIGEMEKGYVKDSGHMCECVKVCVRVCIYILYS